MTAPARRRTRLKPGIRAAREVAATLRDLVAGFCQRRHGEPDPTWPSREYNSVHDGVLGGTWLVPTRLGMWRVHEPADPSIVGLISINTRFDDPARAGTAVGHPRGAQLNPHSGKWNHNWSLDLSPAAAKDRAGLVSLAGSLMVDFEHATTGIFPVIVVPASHYGGPIAPTCSHYPGGKKCQAKATVWIYAPDGEPAPGGCHCYAHGRLVHVEYLDKLGETWPLVPITSEFPKDA